MPVRGLLELRLTAGRPDRGVVPGGWRPGGGAVRIVGLAHGSLRSAPPCRCRRTPACRGRSRTGKPTGRERWPGHGCARRRTSRVVARAAIGPDDVDVAAATERGVMVVDAPTSNTVIYADRPVVVSAALGEAGIDIAGAQAGPASEGGEALMTVTVDSPVAPELFEAIAGRIGARAARAADLSTP
ncbi:hypothetical protein [Blastococcus atacamensis]|nr:hypothetical protein [Blastococcus atacamensis]